MFSLKTYLFLTKTTLFIFCCNYFSAIAAVTFSSENLLKSNDNYLKFSSQYSSNYEDYFEKIVADFNNDGKDDILSIGGLMQSGIDIGGLPHPPYLAEMLLFENGSFVNHDMGVYFKSNEKVVVIDIDKDGDLDIVGLANKIAINDGQANFSMVSYSSERYLSHELYVVDWNNDGHLDIITKGWIYLNDGALQFTKRGNTQQVIDSQSFVINDLNKDSQLDLLVLKDQQLNTWIKNTQGELILQNSLSLDKNYYSIHNLDVNNDGYDDFVIATSIDIAGQTTNKDVKISLLLNDGNGNLNLDIMSFSEVSLIDHEDMQITKLISQDIDNDGDNDLIVNAVFSTYSQQNISCSNDQNILLIYENKNEGLLSFNRALHTTGYNHYNVSPEFANAESYPTFIDINDDGLLDIIMPAQKPIVWLQQNSPSLRYEFSIADYAMEQFNNNLDISDYNNDGILDILSARSYNLNCETQAENDELLSATTSIKSRLLLGTEAGEFHTANSLNNTDLPFNKALAFAQKIDNTINENSYKILITETNTQNHSNRTYLQEITNDNLTSSIEFPHAALSIKMANLDNDSDHEFIMIADTEQAPIIVYKSNNDGFEEIARFDFGTIDGEIFLADMDNDGNIDIVSNKNASNNSVTIYYNNGLGEFTASSPFGKDVKSIAVIDSNNDGLKDIITANKFHRNWQNQGDRTYQKIVYDVIFWKRHTSYEPNRYLNIVPDKMLVKDVNQDGKEDLLAYFRGDLRVFINNSTHDNIYFYEIYNSSEFQYLSIYNYFGSEFLTYNTIVADFNNDKLLDFVSMTNGSLKVHKQTQEYVQSGLYYSQEHSGHGFSIENLGKNNLFYSVFYSYDYMGKPQWYSTLSRYQVYNQYHMLKNFDDNSIIHYSYNYTNNTTSIDETPEFLGWLHFGVNSTDMLIQNSTYRINNIQDSWQIKPIILETQKPENDLSGLWWAGSEDGGWGISLSFVQRENFQDLVAIVYFYDETGEPRWIIGNASDFALNQNITIEMKQINGYGRNQNYVELTELDAGNITLNLKKASQDFNQAGTLSMDIAYPDDISNHNYWTRDSIPIALFSKPR